VETVTWAGNPDKAASVDAAGKLHPRSSFAAWQKIMRRRARPWTELERKVRAFLREQLLHVRDTQKLRKFKERGALDRPVNISPSNRRA